MSDTHTLSEHESKALLAGHGIPFAPERLVSTAEDAAAAASEIGFPVAVKLCGASIAHKTERGLVHLGLGDPDAVCRAAASVLAAATPDDGEVGVLVSAMVEGNRELIAGCVDDAVFGRCVMLGIGGILAEAVQDVVLRLAPIETADALEMIEALRTQALLGEFRGEPAVDRATLADLLVGLGDVFCADATIASIDLNPLIVSGGGKPVAVDALVEKSEDPLRTPGPGAAPPGGDDAGILERFRPLFDPQGVVVAGVSTHPGKFGFVAAHNILRNDYPGAVFLTNRDGADVLGEKTYTSVGDIPDGAADLVFVCTPAGANPAILRECAAKGVRAAFVASAGYGEAGEAGRVAQDELVTLCEELGILLAGPNGQGVVSTPASLCAQIVAPYPQRGSIGVASQSGNFVSSFLNYAESTGVGVSRAVSAGNSAATTVADYLQYFAADPETSVSLTYVEGITDGRAFYEQMRAVAARKPLVVVKGGTTAGGARAAMSHTGSLAADDRIFDGVCLQAGLTREHTIEAAFEAAMAFATQPLPKGPNVFVLTTAGGWGVVTADRITASRDLELMAMPADLEKAIDEKLPPRWSRNNPADMAGGETRDTVPELLEIVASHPAVDAVIFLGLGIQSNQGRLERTGRFFPDHGLERIVSYHERQDARFAEAAVEMSRQHGKPILVATELAITQPDNAGVTRLRELGRPAFSSSHKAVTALEHMWRYARWRDRRYID